MKKVIFLIWVLCIAGLANANITGNPVNDGFTFQGNSLENGVYVRGSTNYGFNTYSSVINITSGSNLAISDGSYSWLAGDTVLAVGGQFANITAAQAGWSSFTGNGVNAILGQDTKLQVKFGTSNASFTTSIISPGSGNGAGSFGSNAGIGGIQVRTSGWLYAADWAAGSGILHSLLSPGHIERNSTSPDAHTARLMWIWNPTTGHVDSWEILLNTSLVRRLNPSFSGPDPAAGNFALMTVQQRDSGYTDALVIIPEPASAMIFAAGMLFYSFKKKTITIGK